MKVVIFNYNILQKRSTYLNQILISILLFSFIFCTGIVFPAHGPYTRNSAKMTSSIDCLTLINLVAKHLIKSGACNNACTRTVYKTPTTSDDITIPNERTMTLLKTCRVRIILVNATLNVNTSENDPGNVFANRYMMV